MLIHFSLLFFSVALYAEPLKVVPQIPETEIYESLNTCPLKSSSNKKNSDIQKESGKETEKLKNLKRMHDKRLSEEMVAQIPQPEFKQQAGGLSIGTPTIQNKSKNDNDWTP